MIDLASLGEIVRSSGRDDFYLCPCCDDQSGHLGVHREKGIFNCFKCGLSGRIKDFSSSLSGFESIVKNKITPMTTINKEPLIRIPLGVKPIKSTSGLPFRYLKKRGITEEEIEKYNLSYANNGFFQDRIIIPIYDDLGILKYFLGRAYTNRSPRYLNSPNPKKNVVFKTFSGRVKEAIISEGVFDAMKIGKVFPAMSILGKIASPEQIDLLVRSADRLFVMLDSDAYREGFELTQKLKSFTNARFIMIYEKDPGLLTPEKIQYYLNQNKKGDL